MSDRVCVLCTHLSRFLLLLIVVPITHPDRCESVEDGMNRAHQLLIGAIKRRICRRHTYAREREIICIAHTWHNTHFVELIRFLIVIPANWNVIWMLATNKVVLLLLLLFIFCCDFLLFYRAHSLSLSLPILRFALSLRDAQFCITLLSLLTISITSYRIVDDRRIRAVSFIKLLIVSVCFRVDFIPAVLSKKKKVQSVTCLRECLAKHLQFASVQNVRWSKHTVEKLLILAIDWSGALVVLRSKTHKTLNFIESEFVFSEKFVFPPISQWWSK